MPSSPGLPASSSTAAAAPTTRRRAVPLRVSLVLLAVVLTALALLVSGVAVTRALEASMLERTDAALHQAERGW
ncbi:two-component sensor histidine kinase, partial [Dietzia sp. Cai40]|nr:two-component sensor histidine kinase [Dietzia sp. Cai40]